jgi:signal transduction histidine kinase
MAFTKRVSTVAPGRRALSPPTLLWAFALVIIAFFGSTLYSTLQERSIDERATDLESDSIPSLESLSQARTALRHLDTATDVFAHATTGDRHAEHVAVERAHDQLVRALMRYLAIPLVYPGEREQAARVSAELAGIEDRLEHLEDLGHDGKPGEALVFADGDLRASVDAMDEGIRALVDINSKAAHLSVVHIGETRRRNTWITLGLDTLSVIIAGLAAWIATRAVKRQAALERAHAELLERRAEDLELFAKRVAHDLLSPLSALSFSLAMVRRAADKGQNVAEPIGRAAACLKRAQRLVDGVFDFARAGGVRPANGGQADLREALDGVFDEVRSDEGTSAVLTAEPFVDVAVACSPGVLTSVLSNLVRNAVKYMRERPEQKVTVRVAQAGGRVHVEVEDTGPGLAAGLEERLFEPYVRGPETGTPGLGLGLSTVRRFVEAHGGAVGVRSAADRGCTFWFELPAAPLPSGDGDLRHHTSARSA